MTSRTIHIVTLRRQKHWFENACLLSLHEKRWCNAGYESSSIKCSRTHSKCHALKQQHGRPLRDMTTAMCDAYISCVGQDYSKVGLLLPEKRAEKKGLAIALVQNEGLAVVCAKQRFGSCYCAAQKFGSCCCATCAGSKARMKAQLFTFAFLKWQLTKYLLDI